MISLEEEPCCKSIQWAIKRWVLYADWISNSLKINTGPDDIHADDFKFCPWCGKPIPDIDEWEYDSQGKWIRGRNDRVTINNGRGPNPIKWE
jgi:hypothetical protein